MRERLLNKVIEEAAKEFGVECMVNITEVKKNNGVVLQAVNIKEPCKNITPNIYIDSLLKRINSGEMSLGEAAQEIINLYKESQDKCNIYGLVKSLNKQDILERVTYQLINAGENQERLCNMPHRKFLDLAIIYIVVIGEDGADTFSFEVNNNICEEYGIEEGELDQYARENTERGGFTTRSIESVLAEITGMPVEDAEIGGPARLWILSNTRMYNGASVMLYTEYFEKLADMIESDLYIFPSSIHEVIVIRDDGADPDILKQIVCEVNLCEVTAVEVLSGNVYRYSRKENKLTIA